MCVSLDTRMCVSFPKDIPVSFWGILSPIGVSHSGMISSASLVLTRRLLEALCLSVLFCLPSPANVFPHALLSVHHNLTLGTFHL